MRLESGLASLVLAETGRAVDSSSCATAGYSLWHACAGGAA